VNDITIPKLCKKCNNRVTFKSLYYGYHKYCSTRCGNKDEDIIQQKKQTCLKKYGVEHQSQTKEFKEKTIRTNLKNFGVNHAAQSPDVIKKTKEFFINKYGVSNPMKTQEVKDRCVNSLKNHHIRDPEFKEKILEKQRSTNLKKFGVSHFMKYDCPSKRRIIDKQMTCFYNKMEIILNKLDIQLLDKKYEHAHFIHIWKCLKCNNTFNVSWNSIQQGYKCLICYPRVVNNGGPSKLELEVLDFINNVLPDTQIIVNDRFVLKPKELDIYIPEKKIAIEFNGLYWHSTLFDNNIDKYYHYNKTVDCKKQNIQLIHIFEDEWIFKEEIVKSRLKQILGVNKSKRIHGRKCIIKEIEPKIKNEFLERFHIQGKDSSAIKLGAFYNDELVSVMTFSKGNISKGSKFQEDVWELNRFCSDYNYHIPGISGKLLSYFKKNYKWKEIFSYADRRWSQGNLYYKLGFELEKITKPNYWYIKDFQRIHRFSLRKRPDEPKNIPEWVLREAEGYGRIYDSGSLKFSIKDINELRS